VPLGFQMGEERRDQRGVESPTSSREGGVPVRLWAKTNNSRSVSR
jgi:hypothetical protein